MRTTITGNTAAAAKTVEQAVRVEHGGETRLCSESEWSKVCDELIAKHGAGVPKVERILPKLALVEDRSPAQLVADGDAPTDGEGGPGVVCAVTVPKFSSFGGDLVVDDAAKARIEQQHEKLRASGVAVDTSQQYFATGTRMAAEGYRTQEGRKVEHAAKMPARDAAAALAQCVADEKRSDVVLSSRELSETIHANGKITALGGFKLSEQAIRGICTRIKSPALGYLLGLRDRLAAEVPKPSAERDEDLIAKTKAQFVSALATELWVGKEIPLKLRTREAQRDIFAVVSPGYTPADAPEVVAQIIDGLPTDARGSWAYDPKTTTWELRAEVWTPTPVAEQAVGEAFEGYARFGSKDNGTGRFQGGGGVTMLRCLNASTYVAEGHVTNRVHRGGIMVDVARMIGESVKAIDALCDAWGVARTQTVALPKKDDAPIPLEVAFPGFWRHLLTDRNSELAVLPGRTEKHVKALVELYPSERRDPAQLVRADFAQTFTKYVQDQPSDVRRDAERAAGAWLASNRPVGCVLAD